MQSGIMYKSKQHGYVEYVGLDNCMNEITYKFRRTDSGRVCDYSYIKPDALSEFLEETQETSRERIVQKALEDAERRADFAKKETTSIWERYKGSERMLVDVLEYFVSCSLSDMGGWRISAGKDGGNNLTEALKRAKKVIVTATDKVRGE